MKNKILTGTLLVFAAIANAQWGGVPLPTGDNYRLGNVCFGGNAVPVGKTVQVGDGTGVLSSGTSGLLIKNATGDRALLEMHDPTGGNKLAIQAHTTGNYIASLATMSPLFLNISGGFVSVNTTLPDNQFHVKTTLANGGITIDQTSSGASVLTLKNSSVGGSTFMLGSASGTGDFYVYDAAAATHRLYLKGSNGHLGVGTNTPDDSKLYVNPGNDAIAGITSYITNSTQANAYCEGITGDARGSALAASAIGVKGVCVGSSMSTAGWFRGFNSTSSAINYGVYTRVSGSAGTNYALYASAPVSLNSYAGHFSGDVTVNGVVTAGSQASWRLAPQNQNNQEPITNAISLLTQLRPVSYDLYNDNCKQFNFDDTKTQFGLIAQEAEKVMPGIVYDFKVPEKRDEHGTLLHEGKDLKGVDYGQLIAVLVKGIQEQQTDLANQTKTNDETTTRIENMQKTLDAWKSGTTTGISKSDLATGAVLDQNIPNPFSGETVINYSLSKQVKNASLIVADLTGKQVASFTLNMGDTSITLSSEKLAAGVYIYSVIADGKILDSKRMVVAGK